MRCSTTMPVKVCLAAAGLSVLLAGARASGGDDNGLFGRLFRGGGPSSPRAAEPARAPSPTPAPGAEAAPALLPPPGSGGVPGPRPESAPPPGSVFEPAKAGGAAVAPRIRPQPRHTTAATEADPLVTRIALGRSDDGKQFGIFLQVFADGTVIDGEGVHHVGADALRPVAQAVQASELYRLKGHCGSPPTDSIEQIYMTVYQQRLGSVRSNSFSISGNPVGCDLPVRQLHVALENLVAKLSGTTAPPAPGGIAPAPASPAPADPAPPAAPSEVPPPSPAIGAPGAVPLTLSPAPPTR